MNKALCNVFFYYLRGNAGRVWREENKGLVKMLCELCPIGASHLLLQWHALNVAITKGEGDLRHGTFPGLCKSIA